MGSYVWRLEKRCQSLKIIGYGFVDNSMAEFGKNFLGGLVESFNTLHVSIEIHKAMVASYIPFLFKICDE